jgi:ribosome-interacting GTPase 1
MPANLPPDYYDAERRLREASTPAEKIACLEEMLTIMPKHKGTDHLKADLRRKISKLKTAAQSKKGGTRGDTTFLVEKEGAAQVMVTGPPNTGKSSLVAALTKARPEISPAPFSTWKPTPGMLNVQGAPIQLVDTPPLSSEYVEPAMLDMIRRADMVLLVVDLLTDPLGQAEQATKLLWDNRIIPRHRQHRYTDYRRPTIVPFLVVANKYDDRSHDDELAIAREMAGEEWHLMAVSAVTGKNLEQLGPALYESLELLRVYSKAPGKEPDMSAPFVLRRGATVEQFAAKVHKEFARKLKTARIWGCRVHDGQMVHRGHVLCDGDVVELHM